MRGNVYPAEIILTCHPAVAQAAFVGVVREAGRIADRGGRAGFWFSLTEAELIAWSTKLRARFS